MKLAWILIGALALVGLTSCQSIPQEDELVSLISGDGRYAAVIMHYDKKTRVAAVRREVRSLTHRPLDDINYNTTVRGNNGKISITLDLGASDMRTPDWSEPNEYKFPLVYYRFDGTHWLPHTPPFKRQR